MLCAASMILGLTSRRLLSTSLAINGKAAIVSGTMEATVPTGVPTISLVSGITMIMRIRKGTERSRFMITFKNRHQAISDSGRIPSLPPTASKYAERQDR